VMKRYYKIVPLLIFFILVGLTVCLASEGGSGSGEGRQIWGMAWRIINFLILAAILWKLLADKIKTYFGDRRVEIAELLEEADKAKRDAENQYTEYQKKLENVEIDIKEIREAIMGELENEKARIIEEGKAAAERIVEQAKWSAEQEVVKARKELRDQVVDMAGDLAASLVTQSMKPDDQKRIVEEYLDKVGTEN
jgi:F-type H+-transporting ATPase subunit b